MKKTKTTIAAALVTTILWIGMAHAIGAIQLPRTGQGEAGTCWDAAGTSVPCAGTGQDGEKRKGVALPSPRFTDVGNGTVTDNLTGLIWLKNANCWSTGRDWPTGVSLANNLASGQCGLSDGSTAGQWRMPNIKELESLVDITQTNPALPAGHPFVNVAADNCGLLYWSSTSDAANSSYAYILNFYIGAVANRVVTTGCGYPGHKSFGFITWPVR